MIPALLRGKLTRSEETLEDLLTSNVFGAFKYASSPSAALIPFLAEATDREGRRLGDRLGDIASASYEFWPWLAEPGAIPAEPDVLITLTHADGLRSALLIEAKYMSGKSSEEGSSPAPSDQLAREYDNLARWCVRHAIGDRFLVYCTAHTALPTREMESSEREYEAKTGQPLRIWWIPWRIIPQLLQGTDETILRDLAEMLRKMGFDVFTGFADVLEGVSAIFAASAWTYDSRRANYDWSVFVPSGLGFRYEASRNAYDWRRSIGPQQRQGEWKWQTDRTS